MTEFIAINPCRHGQLHSHYLSREDIEFEESIGNYVDEMGDPSCYGGQEYPIPNPYEPHAIFLNDYHVANLKALLNAIGYPWNGGAVEEDNPFWIANTGDWVGEIYNKLPFTQEMPNETGEAMAERAREWSRREKE